MADKRVISEHKVRRPKDARPGRTRGASRNDLLELLRAQQVRFLRLQFSDIMGIIKNVEVPQSQFEKALDGDIMF
ncbi:MAG TPA: glutamine synthetase, partial [Longimicrobiales bacterium]